MCRSGGAVHRADHPAVDRRRPVRPGRRCSHRSRRRSSALRTRPGCATASATAASITGVDVQYRSRRLAWPSIITCPAVDQVAGLQRVGELAHACVLADHVAGSGADDRVGDRRDVVQRRAVAAGRSLARPRRTRRLDRRTGCRSACGGRRTGRPRRRRRASPRVSSSARPQSIISAWPATAAAMHSWSMMPLGTPDARCSARRHSSASATGDICAPSASATATSSAALLDRPAPMGMSVVTRPRMPADRPQFGHHTRHVAAPAGLHRCRVVDLERQAAPARARRRMTARWCRARRTLICVQRSIAIGSTSPPV